MSAKYTPEIGQFAFGAPYGEFAVSQIGEAAIASLLDEVRRVFWNRTGREISYQSEEDAETWNALDSGIEWHAYWWGDEESPEAIRPNLVFDSVAVRWYKYPGRGESVGCEMTPDAWSKWLDAALDVARKADTHVW